MDFLFLPGLFLVLSSVKRRECQGGNRGRGQDTRFGCPPVGFRRKRLLCWSFLVFFSGGIFSERKSGGKERAAKELLDRLSLVFSSGPVLSWNRSRRKALKGGWRGLVFGVIRVVFFHRKTDFFEPPDPLFGWSSGSFTLNKLECSKQAKQHALNTLAWDNGIRPWSCFVGFLGTEVMINRDSRGH